MHCTRKICDDIYWVGSSDRRLAKFENLFPIPKGVSYNSYIIIDKKTAVIDTVDHCAIKQFIENIEHSLDGRQLDYLIINHMEPDHCAGLSDIAIRYPNIKIIGNEKTKQLLIQFFGNTFDNNFVQIEDNEQLSLGKHCLQFIFAPMVHWPEVMVSYEITQKLLFSADAFGTFGALNGNIFNNEIDFERDWTDDCRRYYSNIVGKYGLQVQALLKKVENIEIKFLCPLHGPIWRTNIDYIINKYNIWSTHKAEKKGVLIVYASMYGNTENIANIIGCSLAEKGVTDIVITDVSVTDISYVISDVFKYDNIIILSPTYNGGIYPKIEQFLIDIKSLNIQNKYFSVVDNGSWAPTAGKQILKFLQQLRNCEINECVLSVKSNCNDDNLKDIINLVNNIVNRII